MSKSRPFTLVVFLGGRSCSPNIWSVTNATAHLILSLRPSTVLGSGGLYTLYLTKPQRKNPVWLGQVSGQRRPQEKSNVSCSSRAHALIFQLLIEVRPISYMILSTCEENIFVWRNSILFKLYQFSLHCIIFLVWLLNSEKTFR